MKLTREKIALLVFFCLVIVGIGGLVGYLAVGHSWNVAASNIDDAAGSMSGYTAILYEGTLPKKDAAANTQNTPAPEAGATGTDPAAAANAAGQNAPSTSGQAQAPAVTGSTGATPGISPTGEATKDGMVKAPVTVSAVEQSYVEKRSSVLVLDVKNPAQYREGIIKRAGERRLGVMSVLPTDTVASMQAKVNYFKQNKVDSVVVLTPDMKIVQDITGIDIVVSTMDEGLFVMGETKNGTFYVNVPEVGAVGATIISPSNVVSAKVIHEL